MRNLILTASCFCGLTSCDPTHMLFIENKTKTPIIVTRQTIVDTLAVGAEVEIGQCIAHYDPKVSDLNVDHLKIITPSDTIILNGKTAIFSMLQKAGKLNWRIVIKDK